MFVAVNRLPLGFTPYLRSPLLFRCIEATSNFAAVSCARTGSALTRARTITAYSAKQRAYFADTATWRSFFSQVHRVPVDTICTRKVPLRACQYWYLIVFLVLDSRPVQLATMSL